MHFGEELGQAATHLEVHDCKQRSRKQQVPQRHVGHKPPPGAA